MPGMLIKGLLASQMSGSIAGITASHNRGGQYFRARAIPVNPSSVRQQIIRAAMSALAIRWTTVLTQAQRDAWDVYASNVPVTDRLGASRKLTGLNWYSACNTPRVQSGVILPTVYIDAAPIIMTMATLTPPGIVSATAATEVLSISFNNADEWAIAVGGALLVYCGLPQSPGAMAYKGPYRYSGKIAGAVVPPTSPLPITAAFPFGVGNRVHIQTRAITPDGRISPSFRVSGLGV
jgi:hypothetical protein